MSAPIQHSPINKRRGLRAAVAVGGAALLAALAGCAATPADTPFVTEPGAMVGVWTVDATFEDAPEQPFISFIQDGTWIASDGCNRVRGTWTMASDGTITSVAGPHTLMWCEGAQLPTAAAFAERAEVDGDHMRLHSSLESTITDLIRSTDPLVGPQGFPVGYWVEALTPDAPFLSINADRTFTGSDGCNNLFGNWSANASDDERTDFTDVGMTRKACEGVDQWLSQLAMARVVAGVMTLQSADGTVIGQLTAVGR